MRDKQRFQLHFGPYATPRVRIGETVYCESRGKLTVVGVSDGRIQWPLGSRGQGGRTLVVFRGLAKAVRAETNQAVCYWFGITPQTVSKWRLRMGIRGIKTPGERRLKSALFKEPWARAAQRKAWAKTRDPVRVAKIAASRIGKPRPAHVLLALRKANLGKPLSAEHRRKMSEAHKRRGTRPPAAGVAWTAAEDALLGKVVLGKMTAGEVAERTGRTIGAVRCRRRVLGLVK